MTKTLFPSAWIGIVGAFDGGKKDNSSSIADSLFEGEKMKKLLIKIYITLAIVLIVTSLGAFPVTYAADSDAQDQTMVFIENALPVDISKYNVTLKKHSTVDDPPSGGINRQPITRILETVHYILDSYESTLSVNFLVQNNVLLWCKIYVDKGQVISDRPYANLTDGVKVFLEKYQTYTKIDSSNMIAMLDNVDVTKDSTITIGNTQLTIDIIDRLGIERTCFEWAYMVNGADYGSLQVSFQKNGIFVTLRDDRAVYTMGDTSVNISSEQAIDIAMKYLLNYSYDMPNDVTVSGFNVTEDKITTVLATSPMNSLEWRPYWKVELPLNQTYPGSVQGIVVFVWANSGEIFSCNNIAFGGVDYGDSSDFESLPSLEEDIEVIPEFPSWIILPLFLTATLIGILVRKRLVRT